MWEEFDVDIVEYDVLGCVVPIVQVEEVTEVHGLAKRSCPLSLPEPRSSNKNERARSLHFLQNYLDLSQEVWEDEGRGLGPPPRAVGPARRARTCKRFTSTQSFMAGSSMKLCRSLPVYSVSSLPKRNSQKNSSCSRRST